ncbi:hypothetical protein SteCoe_390 [Stentor coeruleus]|uniref:Uncharacterized protein n=1 Tax=Stentor coeruleus TaxID=5963 RepID=A0A1R2D429_9CILI|nr:hypothetical protein SteCoe_390 [Stentor coeruleus]
MAAFIETQSPWLTSIQHIVSKAEKNLKDVQSYTKNRSKSFFLNSSELLSTNFSLEKSGNFDCGMDSFVRSYSDNVEEGCEKIAEKIRLTERQLRKFSRINERTTEVRHTLTIAVDKCEREVVRAVSALRKPDRLPAYYLDDVKEQILYENMQEINTLKTKIQKYNKPEVNVEIIEKKIKETTQDFTKNRHCRRFYRRLCSDISQHLGETIEKTQNDFETIKKNTSEVHARAKSWIKSYNHKETPILPQIPDNLSKVFEGFSDKISQRIKRVDTLACEVKKLENQMPKPVEIPNPPDQSEVFIEISSKIVEELEEIKEKEQTLQELERKLEFLENKSMAKAHFSIKAPDNFTKINISNMGDSDEESISFTSPMTSPMNQFLNYGNSTKNTNKRFMFNGDTIHERPHDEDD